MGIQRKNQGNVRKQGNKIDQKYFINQWHLSISCTSFLSHVLSQKLSAYGFFNQNPIFGDCSKIHLLL